MSKNLDELVKISRSNEEIAEADESLDINNNTQTTSKEVTICFQDRTISELISYLIESFGAKSKVTHNIDKLEKSNLIITELNLYKSIQADPSSKYLLIVQPDLNAESFPTNVLLLSQPLSELKIEETIPKFLGL